MPIDRYWQLELGGGSKAYHTYGEVLEEGKITKEDNSTVNAPDDNKPVEETPTPAPETPVEESPVEDAPESPSESPEPSPAPTTPNEPEKPVETPSPAPEAPTEDPEEENEDSAPSTPAPTNPAPAPTVPESSTGTGGTGGQLVNSTFQNFTSNGVTSQYHIYAEHIDTSKKVGVLVYGDGSGEYGLNNPGGSYLIGGSNGLLETAKKHNMILLTPMAPGGGCGDGGGVCWYQPSSGYTPEMKAQWAADLIQNVYTKYDVDKSRVALGGYSSGAQLVSQFLAPGHGTKIMTDGVVVPISYGGAPRVSANFTDDFKKNVVFSWDTGSADSAYTSSSYGVLGGKSWYDNNGFTTQIEVVDGKGHGRSGEFGGIMDREITEHVKSA